METLTIVAISTLIIFAYTIDWSWLISKVFDIIGGCND